MKHWKLHLWFLINALFIGNLLFTQDWDRRAYIFVPLVFFLTSFLLKTKKEIKEEYTKDIGKSGILLGAGFVIITVYLILKNVNNPSLNPQPTDSQILNGLFVWLIFVIGFYLFTLNKRANNISDKS
ncbi:MAG: hypothetical protein ACK5L8_11505 [Marinicella pacifica]|jgi:predicted transporter